MFYDQREFDIRCEWGGVGVSQLAPDSDAIVIVDVLSFSTCVDIVVGNGATVYPYHWKDESAKDYAHSLDAILANPRNKFDTGYSLAPTSLLGIPAGTRLVLPSPNGSFLSLATGQTPTFAACLRNAEAVAHKIQQLGKSISIIPAGERWHDGSLRPAIEDFIGAGAVIDSLPGEKSPESKLAEAAFLRFREDLSSCLKQCSSGKELIGKGFPGDVDMSHLVLIKHALPHIVPSVISSQWILSEQNKPTSDLHKRWIASMKSMQIQISPLSLMEQCFLCLSLMLMASNRFRCGND